MPSEFIYTYRTLNLYTQKGLKFMCQRLTCTNPECREKRKLEASITDRENFLKNIKGAEGFKPAAHQIAFMDMATNSNGLCFGFSPDIQGEYLILFRGLLAA